MTARPAHVFVNTAMSSTVLCDLRLPITHETVNVMTYEQTGTECDVCGLYATFVLSNGLLQFAGSCGVQQFHALLHGILEEM